MDKFALLESSFYKFYKKASNIVSNANYRDRLLSNKMLANPSLKKVLMESKGKLFENRDKSHLSVTNKCCSTISIV